MKDIPKSTKYTEPVTTITPVDKGSWPGSIKDNTTQKGGK